MTFWVPSDLQAHLEVLPKHGIVQGESSFAAQLKFKPLKSLLEQPTSKKYYTPSDDTWKMPIQVGVANQVCTTVVISVKLVLTISLLYLCVCVCVCMRLFSIVPSRFQCRLT